MFSLSKDYKFFALSLSLWKNSSIRSNIAMNRGKNGVGKATVTSKGAKNLKQVLQQADGGGAGVKIASGLNQNTRVVKTENIEVCP
jgi:hypothetical protein